MKHMLRLLGLSRNDDGKYGLQLSDLPFIQVEYKEGPILVLVLSFVLLRRYHYIQTK